MRRVSYFTLGCRLNASESEGVMRDLVALGYRVVPFGKACEIVFLQTCTVTAQADASCRNVIRRAKRDHPEALLVVSGCFAEVQRDEIRASLEIDLLIRAEEKEKSARLIDKLYRERGTVSFEGEKTQSIGEAATSKFRTRAFVKIHDGCNYFCAYCIVPHARGRVRSTEIAEVIVSVRRELAAGVKEVVLTGVNIGEYRSGDGGRLRLSDVVREVLTLKHEGLRRLRLSSIEPNTVSDALLEVLKGEETFLPHFHLPLQSASDHVLSLMGRRYRFQDYERVVAKILNFFPDAGIGCDLIAGFPGEEEEHFEEAIKRVSELPIHFFHLFPFSPRPGTKAFEMIDQRYKHVHKRIADERVKRLSVLAEEKLLKFAEKMQGRVVPVLFEGKGNRGYTPNYLEVECDADADIDVVNANEILDVRLREFDLERRVFRADRIDPGICH
ncbi:MAG: tRNA (N(6)-L-threonylcarbamoyladenosine(37)-C(2))-methylthiotransferase MtaB [Oligoflexia bacterium]|nr:tRNA (N(6)-L-threonylcarbamoyladenosine(37)-C(2))-methylthiotransferase MtaB [Oligoflexia bacterium]